MFKLSEFIKKGLLRAVGKMADYQIILNAAAWHEKGVLNEEDLAEISSALETDTEDIGAEDVPEEEVSE